MAELQAKKTIVINASAEAIWKIMADISAWPRWFPTIREAGPLAGAALAPGSTLYFKAAVAGPAMKLKVKVSESRPPKKLAWTGGMLGVSAVHGFDFEPEGQATRVTSWENFTGPMVGVLKLIMTEEKLGRLHQEWIEALKTEAEKGRAG